jgi:hypothetical protein
MSPRVFSLLLVACASPAGGPDPTLPADAAVGTIDGTNQVPDVRCSGAPDAGPAGSFRHLEASVISALGSPRHRGIDLVSSAGADQQTLAGAISYTVADKALEDEDVDLFACRDAGWGYLGRTRTDGEGRFAMVLAGADRLPLGMHDVFVSVVGDRTGAGFLAYVAPDNARLFASDVDGTLTSSENAFWKTVALGTEPGVQPGAADALHAVSDRGYQVVYVSARGSQYTTETRAWLERNGFPRGPLRLSPSFITLPGEDTVELKTTLLGDLAAVIPVVAGVGNRASDIEAYTNVGIDPKAIFVKLPEYAEEVRGALSAGAAIGFTDFGTLASLLPR